MPGRTIRDWTTTDWWRELLLEVRTERDEQIDATYTRIIEASAQAVEDRLQNGDEVIVSGEPRRRMVSGKDAAVIGAVTFDKRQLLRKLPTAIRREQTDKVLADRLRQFERMANAKIIDGEFSPA